MQNKTKIFLWTALLLLALAIRGVVLSRNEAEKEAGAVFVREEIYAENRV